MSQRDEYIAGEEKFAPILKTGDRFTATTTILGSKDYEFVGYAPFCPTGCAYLILKNLENGHHIGVEHNWFRREICGRIIKIHGRSGKNVPRA